MLAVALYGVFEATTFALLPIWGVRVGLAPAEAAATLTAIGIGSLALQVPIGWLSDRLARRAVLRLCGAAGLMGALLLPFLAGSPPMLFLALVLWGGCAGGIYPVALGMAGARFRGAELLGANAAVIIAYGLGSLVGPALGGAAMDFSESARVAGGVGAAVRRFQRRRKRLCDGRALGEAARILARKASIARLKVCAWRPSSPTAPSTCAAAAPLSPAPRLTPAIARDLRCALGRVLRVARDLVGRLALLADRSRDAGGDVVDLADRRADALDRLDRVGSRALDLRDLAGGLLGGLGRLVGERFSLRWRLPSSMTISSRFSRVVT